MSNSPEIDCNHDHTKRIDDCSEICLDCGQKWIAVMTSPDDFDWIEV